MKLLALGDVVGEATLAYLRRTLPEKRRELGADLVIANGENVCDVHGISPAAAQGLLDAGVDFITSGNHIFDRKDGHALLDSANFIIRPCNYPAECPGEGARMVTSADGWQILVVNVSGCSFMEPLANPFSAVRYALDSARAANMISPCSTSTQRPPLKNWRSHIISMANLPQSLARTHTYKPTTHKFFQAGRDISPTLACLAPFTASSAYALRTCSRAIACTSPNGSR